MLHPNPKNNLGYVGGPHTHTIRTERKKKEILSLDFRSLSIILLWVARKTAYTFKGVFSVNSLFGGRAYPIPSFGVTIVSYPHTKWWRVSGCLSTGVV